MEKGTNEIVARFVHCQLVDGEHIKKREILKLEGILEVRRGIMSFS